MNDFFSFIASSPRVGASSVSSDDDTDLPWVLIGQDNTYSSCLYKKYHLR